VPHEHARCGRYRRRSGTARAGFLRAAPPPGRYGKLGVGTDRVAPPPARRGYGYRTSTPVVDGTGVGRARPGQGSYAPSCPPWSPARQAGRWYGPAPPALPASRFLSNKRNEGSPDGAWCGVETAPENGAFRDSLNSRAIFRRACGAIFHNPLKQQKIAPGLDATAPSGRMNRACCENAAA